MQFSGAIWFPMVYELPARAKQALGLSKRERQFDRTLRYIDECGARFVFPTAGPPCFLDEELWGFNDIFGDESNIFPDQAVYLRLAGREGASARAGCCCRAAAPTSLIRNATCSTALVPTR